MPELTDSFRKSWQKAGDDIKTMKLEQLTRIRDEHDAWKEAFLATRSYHHNNNGPNSTRYRAAIKQLKEMKLIK